VAESPAPARNVGLDEIWRDAARRATDWQLALLAGLIVPVAAGSALAILLKPHLLRWLPWLVLPLFLAAFGFWGIADREIRGAPPDRPGVVIAWSLLRVCATALAVACSVVAMMLFLRLTIGTWIS
jgi:hypothetical protein